MRAVKLITLAAILLHGCGSSGGGSSVGSAPATITAPLSFELSELGAQEVAIPDIATNNLLKVKFTVGLEQGSNLHQATELKITITVNGTEVSPSFTSNNYMYGPVGQSSNVLDLSSYIVPGQPVRITLKQPKSDYYCTFWGGYYTDSNGVNQLVNPLYNQYPGCRKEINPAHTWSGTLTVQTNSTEAI